MINKFRFWCHKVLPLVYDDSLSYYELLCKVVHKLNEVIDNENELSEGFKNVQEIVNQTVERVDEYTELVDRAVERVDEYTELVERLSDDIAELTARVVTTEGNVNQLTVDVAQLKNKMSQAEGDITSIKERTANLENAVNVGIPYEFASLQNWVTNVETKVNKVDGETAALDDRVTAIEGSLGDDTSGLVADVAQLKNKTSQAEGDITSLEERTANLENAVNVGIPYEFTSLQNWVTNVETKVNEVDGETAALDARVSAVEEEVQEYRVAYRHHVRFRYIDPPISPLTYYVLRMVDLFVITDDPLPYTATTDIPDGDCTAIVTAFNNKDQPNIWSPAGAWSCQIIRHNPPWGSAADEMGLKSVIGRGTNEDFYSAGNFKWKETSVQLLTETRGQDIISVPFDVVEPFVTV